MDHVGTAVVNTKLFVNSKLDKESWHCSSKPVTQAVTCEAVATPPYGVNFSGT